MATKIIPEKRIFVCDCCGKENARRKMNTVLVFQCSALDFVGDPVGDGTTKSELCDDCAIKIREAINSETSKIKNQQE